MLKVYFIVVSLLLTQQLIAQNQNFVRSWEAKIPITDASTMNGRPVTEVLQTTGYTDGLGRPVQIVVKEGSNQTQFNNTSKTDVVTSFVYDAFGREVKKYLPYAATTNDGLRKPDPINEQYSFFQSQLSSQGESYFYSNSDVENSPLNRVTKTYPPGNSWVGAGRGVAMNYLTNTAADDVKIWAVNGPGSYSLQLINNNNYYGAGLLSEMHTTDEHGNKVVEYKDKEGKVILKKVQVNATINDSYMGWLCTYYVYDIYNNLRLVIQPKGVQKLIDNGWVFTSNILNELCFQYEYDSKNRMSIKKLPGAGEIYIIYDKWDRLLLTQDGNMRALNRWVFNKYDNLNRLAITGFYINISNLSQSSMQAYVDAFTNPGRYESTINSGIGYTTTATFPSITNPDLLTISFYDNYGWTINYDNSYSTIDISNTGLFYGAGSPLYAQPITQSLQVKGLMTGTVSYILNSTSGQKLIKSIIYDNRGRAIQTKAQNITTGIDITTTQYNFNNQPLMSVLQHEKAGDISQSIKIITKHDYDDLGRLKEIKKKITQTIGNNTIPAIPVENTIVKNEYDKLGQLVTKYLAPGFNNNAGLEQLTYDYNVRGWLTSINKNYLNGITPSKYFGLELAYDKTTTVVSGANYANAQYNGNINGLIWKSKGDEVNRQYDFGYDKVNRLMEGLFKQKNNDNSWNNSIVNYNMKMGDGTNHTSAYDENGNIKRMQQWGLKLTMNEQIDDLIYIYSNNDASNKLIKVTDSYTNPVTKLGDFKDGSNTGNDYAYDVNGNLINDENKNILANQFGNGIRYNHLNLPDLINVQQKGGITYIYDASGNKLQKETIEDPSTSNGNRTITSTTHYINGLIYESRNSVPADPIKPDYSYKLQFAGHEEGRIRYKAASGNILADFAYDYFIKDHLGNVRMVLTEEIQQDVYPAATLENVTHNGGNAVSLESQYYNIDASKIVNKSNANQIPDYPNNNGNPPYNNNIYSNENANSERLYQLNATTNSMGLAIVLKVMSGDQVNIFAKSYHNAPSGGYTNPTTPLTLANILNGFVSSGPVAAHGVTTTQISGTNGFPSNLSQLFSNQPEQSSTIPRAFINWIIFDEQFKFVSSGFDQVGRSQFIKDHSINSIPTIAIPKNGYIYIYCSNESNYNVFFDNLQLIHTRGQILEETHYYPFGLIQSGISSKAAGKLENNKSKYNSYELNTNFDLNLYESFYRLHDPQLGRFWQADSKPKYDESVYATMGNNPILSNDLLGDTSVYYNNANQKLGTINSSGSLTAVIVGDNFASMVGLLIGAVNAREDISQNGIDKFDAALNTTGIAYDIAAFDKFGKDNSNKYGITSIGGVSVNAMSDISINGKSSDRGGLNKTKAAESFSNLIYRKGKLTVENPGGQSAGDLIRGYPTGSTHIHTHSAITYEISYKIGNNPNKFTTVLNAMNPGLSGDQTLALDNLKNTNLGPRNVVVTKEYIYLINGIYNQTISIPRK